jgi:hypothetical protein
MAGILISKEVMNWNNRDTVITSTRVITHCLILSECTWYKKSLKSFEAFQGF